MGTSFVAAADSSDGDESSLCGGWGEQVAKQHPALLREAEHLEQAVKAKAAIQGARAALSRTLLPRTPTAFSFLLSPFVQGSPRMHQKSQRHRPARSYLAESICELVLGSQLPHKTVNSSFNLTN